jgi:hypothetical protein
MQQDPILVANSYEAVLSESRNELVQNTVIAKC